MRSVTRSIAIVVPIRPSTNSGNDVTAARWAQLLAAEGHSVEIVPIDEGATMGRTVVERLQVADVLLAVHARRSAPAVVWWHTNRPDRPLIVALAGTDLYRDMPDDVATMTSVDLADALIVLQETAIGRLEGFDTSWPSKTHVIHQSVSLPIPERQPVADEFRVVVLAHLRPVKDPLLAAQAARLLGDESRLVVHHAGAAHDVAWHAAAEHEMASNRRYVWHGELAAEPALALLATADVLACTSLSEGGANVVTEALACGVPVVATRIDGNTGLLGVDYPGLVEVGDVAGLASLLADLEHDADRLADLQRRVDARRGLSDPDSERTALSGVIDSLVTHRRSPD